MQCSTYRDAIEFAADCWVEVEYQMSAAIGDDYEYDVSMIEQTLDEETVIDIAGDVQEMVRRYRYLKDSIEGFLTAVNDTLDGLEQAMDHVDEFRRNPEEVAVNA